MFKARLDVVEVLPGLWVGSRPSRRQARQLALTGIERVIDLRAEGEPVEWPPGVEVTRLALVDHGSPSMPELEAAATVVREAVQAGSTVLVHCQAGLERAPAVACAALLLMGWRLEEAFQRVREARSGAMPTDGQLAALRELADRAQDHPASRARPAPSKP